MLSVLATLGCFATLILFTTASVTIFCPGHPRLKQVREFYSPYWVSQPISYFSQESHSLFSFHNTPDSNWYLNLTHHVWFPGPSHTFHHSLGHNILSTTPQTHRYVNLTHHVWFPGLVCTVHHSLCYNILSTTPQTQTGMSI